MESNIKKMVKIILFISMFLGVSQAKVENITITGSMLSKDPTKLATSLKEANKIIVEIYNGSWVRSVTLPLANIDEDSQIIFHAKATWSTEIKNENFNINLHYTNKTFTYKNGYWDDRKPSISLYGGLLGPLNNNADNLKTYINDNQEVILHFYNGSWIGKVILPEKGVKEHSKVTLKVTSSYGVSVKTSEKVKVLRNGDNETYIYENGRWRHRIPTFILNTRSSVGELGSNANIIKEYLKTIRQLHIKIRDGVWTGNIVLPDGVEEGSEVLVDAYSTWGVNVKTSEKTTYLRYQSKKFVYKHNAWEYRIPRTVLWGTKVHRIGNSAEVLKKHIDNAQAVVLYIYDGSWVKDIVLPEDVKEYSRVTIKANSTWATNVKISNETLYVHHQNIELIYLYGQWVELSKATTREYLNLNDMENNIYGDFEGMFQFAQTHTIYPNSNNERNLPRLVSGRTALAIFIPKVVSKNSSYVLEVFDADDTKHEIMLLQPKFQPETAKIGNFTATLTRPNVIYSKNAWTAKIPAKLIYPGMRIEIKEKQNGSTIKNAEVDEIDVGPVSKVSIYNIRLGMLTPHRDLAPNPEINDFEGSYTLAKDYFNKIPVTTLTVANYAPMTLDKIVLPNGNVYTDMSDGNGGVYVGDMRGYIAKLLVSDGINNANYGVNSWPTTESGNHFTSMHTIHRAQGKYQNGIRVHGYSGGNGMITLAGNTGNEFSHELGHSYGLGHYPGGSKNYIHSKRSGWGYDVFKNIFISNFSWYTTTADVPLFMGYRYSTDTMAGGGHSTKESKYTLHTGYSQMLIQKRLEARGIFDSASPTGYSIWSSIEEKMIPKTGKYLRKALKYGVPVKTILAYYDPSAVKTSYIYPAFTSNYGNVYEAQYNNEKCYAQVKFVNNEIKKYGLISTETTYSHKMHINLDSAKEPTSVSIICKINNIDKILSTRQIDNAPVKIEPDYIISSH